MTYTQAKDLLSKSRKDTKNLKHMTDLRKVETGYAIRYWDTDVVTIHEDNTYTLNSGGYLTMTTKERINEYSPGRLYQNKGLWYHKNDMVFIDNCIVDADGMPIAVDKDMTINTRLVKGKLDRMVSKYIKGFMSMLMETKTMPMPSNGDCWGCLMVDASGKTDCMGYDHLLSHFTEKYYVPSLLANAVKEHHGDNAGFIWGMIAHDVERGRDSYHFRNAMVYYFRKRKPALLALMLEQFDMEAAG